ncbi:AT-hook motif nuclear-localized protein 17 [Zea mays]|uniref:AT-hook motif nuclear-localized protein 17 n=1 Tax=Zea mays TaxID=4577 RepID=A0A317Y2F4_MAIZE|nr:AT-hook motif nuclear-localized protein 17 [Zea mays]
MDREGHYGGRGRLLECFSDEVSSRNGGGEERANDGGGPRPPAPGSGVVGAWKRRRGRPPGSKNKPKPPSSAAAAAVARDVEPASSAMRPHVLEVPSGGDVARALAGFARRRGLGICVLAGTGAVADVSLRHPSSSADGAGGSTAVFRGRYEILSISATFLAPSTPAAVARATVRDLSVSLAGPHGQVVGGAVVGPLVAATAVVVLAAAFTDLTFHRLPLEDDAPASVSGTAGADERRWHGRYQPPDPEQHDAGGSLHPQAMAPATQPVPLFARESHELWPAAPASAQRPRSPYQ